MQNNNHNNNKSNNNFTNSNSWYILLPFSKYEHFNIYKKDKIIVLRTFSAVKRHRKLTKRMQMFLEKIHQKKDLDTKSVQTKISAKYVFSNTAAQNSFVSLCKLSLAGLSDAGFD